MTAVMAPDFTLTDQHNKSVSLKDYRGRWIVLYFYAQDEALGCTTQACSFRDEYRIIQQFGAAEVIGINHASVESHQAFSEAHQLNFPILSDPEHEVTSAYNSWRAGRAKLLGGSYGTQRNTFLINPKGEIVKKYIGVKRSQHHTQQVIQDLQKFQDQASA
jgi:peroxiredoxin Q/BCP